MKKKLSRDLFLETEKVGEKFDLETHAVIFDRYHFAGNLSKGRKILEVGCGSGIGLEYLSTQAENVQAIEFSKENLDFLKHEEIGSATVIEGDAHEMTYKSNSFDLVIALAMIYYLSLRQFLTEVSRVLKDDGTLFFCTSNKDVPGFCAAPFTTDYYSIPELHSELDRMGFHSEFYGAFPKDKGSLRRRVLLAAFKDYIKSLFELTQIGKGIWRNLRLKTLGELVPLPKKITQENIQPSERVILDHRQPNYEYKVIYVVAKKKCQ